MFMGHNSVSGKETYLMDLRSEDFINDLLSNIQNVLDSKSRLFEYSGSETVREAFNEAAEEVSQIKTLFQEKTETFFNTVLVPSAIISTPSILNGEPVVLGTKLSVATIAEHVNKYGVPQTMENFNLSREQILDACWFVAVYGVESIQSNSKNNSFYKGEPFSRKWTKKWRQWAEESRELFEQRLYGDILDPYEISPESNSKD
jgi:uncharacterized protein (DUF433 family)